MEYGHPALKWEIRQIHKDAQLYCLSHFVPGKLEQAVNLWQLKRAVPESPQTAPTGDQVRMPSSLAQHSGRSCGGSGVGRRCTRESRHPSLTSDPSPCPHPCSTHFVTVPASLLTEELAGEEGLPRGDTSGWQQAQEDVISKAPMLFLGNCLQA